MYLGARCSQTRRLWNVLWCLVFVRVCSTGFGRLCVCVCDQIKINHSCWCKWQPGYTATAWLCLLRWFSCRLWMSPCFFSLLHAWQCLGYSFSSRHISLICTCCTASLSCTQNLTAQGEIMGTVVFTCLNKNSASFCLISRCLLWIIKSSKSQR